LCKKYSRSMIQWYLRIIAVERRRYAGDVPYPLFRAREPINQDPVKARGPRFTNRRLAHRHGAGLQIRGSIPALSSRPTAAIGRSFPPQSACVHATRTRAGRLNIPNAYRYNSVATVLSLRSRQGIYTIKIRTRNVSALLRGFVRKPKRSTWISNVTNSKSKGFYANVIRKPRGEKCYDSKKKSADLVPDLHCQSLL